MVDEYLILEFGKREGITVSDNERKFAILDIKQDYQGNVFQELMLRDYADYEEWKEDFRHRILIEKILKNASERMVPVTSEEIKAYFEEHREDFRYPKMVKFRQIVSSSKEEADNLLKRIQKGEEMSELARKYSIAPEAESGGEISWVAQEHLDESMGNIVFSLAPGELSPVVETPYGYHIFEVIARRPQGFRSLPDAMAEIEAKLLEEKKEAFYGQWLKELRGLFTVKVNRELLETLELG